MGPVDLCVVMLKQQRYRSRGAASLQIPSRVDVAVTVSTFRLDPSFSNFKALIRISPGDERTDSFTWPQ
jgi:hypothetical protein